MLMLPITLLRRLFSYVLIMIALLQLSGCAKYLKHDKSPFPPSRTDNLSYKFFVSGDDTLYTWYRTNELVVSFKDMSQSESRALSAHLQDKGFSPADTCICSDLQLWRHPESGTISELNGVVAGAPKKGNGVGDSTGLSLNYVIVLPSEPLNPEEEQINGFINDTQQQEYDIKVGIIDSGVNLNHQGLSSHMRGVSSNPCNDNLQDSRFGLDVNSPGNRPQDLNGHGSHINGIVAGLSSPSGGTAAGIDIQLINVRVTKGWGIGLSLFDAVCGMHYAMRKGAKVLNLSWGYYDSIPPDIMYGALEEALDSNVLIIAAAGNGEEEMTETLAFWPAGLSRPNYETGHRIVLSVGAYNQQLRRLAKFSNWGNYAFEVVAPGRSIRSSHYNYDNNYRCSSGTSMATPFVSRTAAVIMGTDKNMLAEAVKKIIIDNAEAVSARRTYTDREMLKLLNHDAALRAVRGTIRP